MNALFKNQTTLTKTAYIETALSSNKTIVSIILFLTSFGFISTGYEAYTIKEDILVLCCLGGAIITLRL